MFFCDVCVSDWTPETVPVMAVIPDWVRSFGPCELCHVARACWDIPSFALPPPRYVFLIAEVP